MSYSVAQTGRSSGSFGNYNYEIYRDGKLVARYWHDYRGDDHGLEFTNRVREQPVGRMVDFLEGGGPKPLVPSSEAIAYLDRKLPE